MATKSRGSIEARLAELESRRDRVIDRLADRYLDRAIEIAHERYSLEERTVLKSCLDNGEPLPDEVQAVIMADPEVQQISALYNRLAMWRANAELFNPYLAAVRRRDTRS